MKKIPYEDLAFLPWLIAECVATRPYEEQEYSVGVRSVKRIAKVEARRQEMTPADVKAFTEYTDKRCRQAYDAGAKWFMECANSKTNRGRDQLYVWVTHWLVSWMDAKANGREPR